MKKNLIKFIMKWQFFEESHCEVVYCRALDGDIAEMVKRFFIKKTSFRLNDFYNFIQDFFLMSVKELLMRLLLDFPVNLK